MHGPGVIAKPKAMSEVVKVIYERRGEPGGAGVKGWFAMCLLIGRFMENFKNLKTLN